MAPHPRRPADRRGDTGLRSVADLPLWAVPCVVGGGLVVTLVGLGLVGRHAGSPVVAALAPAVGGSSGVGFVVGFLACVPALLLTVWVWRRLWRGVRPGDVVAHARSVVGVVAWFLSLVPWSILMPNLRGRDGPGAVERLVIADLSGARPGALAGTFCAVVLLVVLGHRRRPLSH